MFGVSKEMRFWKWFQENEDCLFHYETDQEAIFDRLEAELKKVYPSAAFQFGPILADGRREFILSAHSAVEDFPAVERLYAEAPDMPRWIVLKFIPRRPEDRLKATKIAGQDFQTSNLSYLLYPAGDQVELRLFYSGASSYDKDDLSYFVWIALHTFLGEEDFALRVRRYSIHDESANGYADSHEIASLAATFDAYFAEQKKSYH